LRIDDRRVDGARGERANLKTSATTNRATAEAAPFSTRHLHKRKIYQKIDNDAPTVSATARKRQQRAVRARAHEPQRGDSCRSKDRVDDVFAHRFNICGDATNISMY